MTYIADPRKPSIIERARLALQVYTQGLPSRPWGRSLAQKAAPFLWPEWRLDQAQWHVVDYGTYVQEGFNVNSLIYAAIMYKVRALSQAPLRAYTGEWDHPELLPTTHPLSQLLARPNPYMSWREMQGLADVYLNLDGNAYFMQIRRARGKLPTEIYPLRPDRVHIIPRAMEKSEAEQPGLIGFVYVPEGRVALAKWSGAQRREALEEGRILPIPPEDMMHIKLPNPMDPLEGLGYGLSPVSSLARPAEVDNAVTRFLDSFFKKGTMMSGILKYDWELGEDDIARARRRWREIYGGQSNWTDIGVLDKGVNYQRIGLTFDEMGFEALDERNEARILGPFGVPPILIGARIGLKRATYANYEEARRAFWEDTFTPELGLFEQEYGYHLVGDDGAFVRHDLSRVPALQHDIGPMVEAALKLFRMGVPSNIALPAVGLDQIGEVPGGDIGYLPHQMVPVQTGTPSRNGGSADPDTDPDAEPDDKSWTGDDGPTIAVKNWLRQNKEHIGHATDIIAASWEKRFGDAAWDQFEAEKTRLLAILNQKKKRA